MDEAQEMLSSAMEAVEQLKRTILEESQSPETIRRIAKLLKINFDTLIRMQLVDPHNETVAEAITEVDSLIADYTRLGYLWMQIKPRSTKNRPK